METKEQKPWYEDAEWGAEDCGSIYGHTAISGRMSDGSMHHSFAQVVTTLDGKSYQLGEDALSFIINAPKVATERDAALSVQKQLVEALELSEGRLALLMAASLPESDHPGATQYVLDKARAAILAAKASS